MWSFDMNCCTGCSRVGKCPDAKTIQKGLRSILDATDANEGGSETGVIVVVCKDQNR